MAYIPNEWKDQVVQRPKTYQMNNNDDGSVTLIDSFGLVTELGTPVNQDYMNHIEQGIAGCAIRYYSATETFKDKEAVLNVNEEGDIELWQSLADNNLGNPLSDETKWKKVELGGTGGSGFNLFDIVVKDHVLSFEESKGFALQGTYVYKDAVPGSRYGYPDFYAKCIEEKEAGTQTQTTLGESTITTYNNANGHVFYDIADKAAVDAFYESTGAAWFYGVDTVNERIFLPRNDWFFQSGNADNVGNFNAPGLPNLDGNSTIYMLGDEPLSGCFKHGHSNSGWSLGQRTSSADTYLAFDASNSNPIYGKSDTVQPPAVNQCYYIVVGNTAEVQSTTVELTTNSAVAPISFDSTTGAVKLNYADGLSLDTDGNLTGLTAAQAASASRPSDKYIDLTLGASRDTYTAPDDGYILFKKKPTASSQFIAIESPANNLQTSVYSTQNSGGIAVYLPVKKNSEFTVRYSMAGETDYFRFIYAQGSVPASTENTEEQND